MLKDIFAGNIILGWQYSLAFKKCCYCEQLYINKLDNQKEMDKIPRHIQSSKSESERKKISTDQLIVMKLNQ